MNKAQELLNKFDNKVSENKMIDISQDVSLELDDKQGVTLFVGDNSAMLVPFLNKDVDVKAIEKVLKGSDAKKLGKMLQGFIEELQAIEQDI